MLTRNFGTSSLQVSALGFGAGHIGSDGVTERDAHVLLDRALDLGINFFDTARGYGLSEERIGRWLPAHRDEVVLSTKVGYGVEGAGVFGAVQSSVNLADQRSLCEVLPDASRRGLGIVAKRPLASAPWRHSERPVGVYGETYWLRLRELGLEPESDDWQGTALRFSASTPGVSTAIVGTSRTANLEAAAAAVERGPLPVTERARWEQAFAPHAGVWAGGV